MIHVSLDESVSISVSNCFESILSKDLENSQSPLVIKISSMNLYVLCQRKSVNIVHGEDRK